jgi:hypothetical protein
MCYRAARAVRGQMSGLGWIRAPDGGCFGILIVGVRLRRASGYREIRAVTRRTGHL